MQPEAPELSTSAIVDGFEWCFDAGDRANGSLYLAVPRGAGQAVLAEAVAGRLRAAGLWSDAPEKWVAEEQRVSYGEQLALVAARRYRHQGTELLAARFDHPKFPSDAMRWAAWLDVLDAELVRA
ncbi:MAG: hypothetical protein KA321_01895 [Pseudomonadales bacterium]|jgi:hypothetical protein|nr:hypothetical protein [Pseudomonadales bacterium]